MIETKLSELGRNLGFHRGTSSVFGVYAGYQTNIFHDGKVDSTGNKTIFVQAEEMTEDQQNAVLASIESRKKELKYSTLTVNSDAIVLLFTESIRTTKPEVIRAALEAAGETFAANGVQPHFARTPDGSFGHYVFEGAGTVLPKEEAQTMRHRLDTDREQRSFEESGYLSGAVGAFLGGMIGVIGWVALAYFTGYITAFLAMAIVYLSWIGYGKLNGKMGLLTKPVLIAVNLVLIVVASFLTVAAETRDYGLSVSDTFEYVTSDATVREDFLVGLLLPLLFMGLGIFYVVREVNVNGPSIEDAPPL
ncbi:hypothetical protein [Neolewinella antarctica]|uniref:Membrane protein n=1 Tax=Neolewinella antarctica TaxID=442734 RepID=A0ABX0XAD7_9BACT|nr:hypothetical protein [Neolewinella antarctica]NJC26236.1 putative membrane protein [Neolewinella antarctica]